ncbi:MAG: right-handed parallel beta-helix repeat-containing protein [Bacteroidota bacterium]
MSTILIFTDQGNHYMRLRTSHIILLTFAFLTMLQTACKKDSILSSGGIVKFSTDTLKFDTVFTAQGSFTTSLNIYNPQGEKIKISSVRMEKGANSPFHLNVDGFQGNNVTNIEMAAYDSIYVFATVNIDPTNANTPFLVEDRLIVTLNGKDFYVPFTALGQNAHYIIDSVLQTQTWDTIKPYVIIHNAFVNAGATLTIPAGCKVYMHQDSKLYVFGTLKVNGTPTDTVVFQGDRLDRAYFGYKGYPGEWGGIYFDSYSTGNVLNYTTLKNCGNSTSLNGQAGIPAAIQLAWDSVGGIKPQLSLYHTKIYNSIGYGIFSYHGTVHAENCLIHSCGAQALGIFRGGNDTFTNCTFACYSTYAINHTSDNPTVGILNYLDLDPYTYESGDLNAVLTNCVMWGSQNDEAYFHSKTGANYNLKLNNCLIKNVDTGTIPSYVDTAYCIMNVEPRFKDSSTWDFHPTANSPMIDRGATISSILDDIEAIHRPQGAGYDIGCYEYKP